MRPTLRSNKFVNPFCQAMTDTEPGCRLCLKM